MPHRDKHSSLLTLTMVTEKEKFYGIDSWCQKFFSFKEILVFFMANSVSICNSYFVNLSKLTNLNQLYYMKGQVAWNKSSLLPNILCKMHKMFDYLQSIFNQALFTKDIKNAKAATLHL